MIRTPTTLTSLPGADPSSLHETLIARMGDVTSLRIAQGEKLDLIASVSTRIAVVLLAYLAVITVANLAARRSRNVLIGRTVGLVTPRFLTTLLIGVGATAAPAAAQTNALSPTAPEISAVPYMYLVDDPVMEVVASGHTVDVAVPSGVDEPPGGVDVVTPPTTSLPEPRVHVVTVGEHFWSIAEATLRAAAFDPDPSAVTRYWSDLVDANRDRLIDPDNPDLIVPGQRLVLPPLP